MKTPTNDMPEDNLQDIDEDSLYSKKPKQSRAESKKEEPTMEKKKEEVFFGFIWRNFSVFKLFIPTNFFTSSQ